MGNMCFSQVFCCVLFVPSVCTNKLDKPNIIIPTVDDLGWNAILSSLTIMTANSKNHQTPNIDKFISDGMAFTNAYTPLRNCALMPVDKVNNSKTNLYFIIFLQ